MTCLQQLSSAVTHNIIVQLQPVAAQSGNHSPCLHTHLWFESCTVSSTERLCLGEQAHNMHQLAGLQQEQQELAARLAALKEQHSDLQAQLQHQARPSCLLFLCRSWTCIGIAAAVPAVLRRGSAVFCAA